MFIRFFSLLFFLLLLPHGAWAGGKQARLLRQAINFHDKLQFDKALQILNSLVRDPHLTKKQRAKAYLYQGFCFFYLKGAELARLKLSIALRLNPQSTLPPQTPPPLRKLFLEEKKAILAELKAYENKKRKSQPTKKILLRDVQIAIRVVSPTPLKAGQLIHFYGLCSPHIKGGRVAIFIRKSGDKTYQKYPLQWKGENCFGKIPNPYPSRYSGGGSVEFVISMRDQQGKLIEQSHPFHHPARIPLQAPTNPWLIPTIITVSLVASLGVVVAILLTTPSYGIDVSINFNSLTAPTPLPSSSALQTKGF